MNEEELIIISVKLDIVQGLVEKLETAYTDEIKELESRVRALETFKAYMYGVAGVVVTILSIVSYTLK